MTVPEETVTRHRDDVEQADRFAWRAWLRRRPAFNAGYRMLIGVLGLAIIVLGIIALPLPGPGWAIIFTGLGLWATEFAWAKRLLRWTKQKVLAWARWLQRQSWWMQGLVSLGIVLLVVVIIWLMLVISGIPTFLPDWIADLLDVVPGLD